MPELQCAERNCSQTRTFWSRVRQTGYELDGGWYCSDECLRQMLVRWIGRNLQLPSRQVAMHRRSRIGAILIRKGLLNREQLEQALEQQREDGQSLGQVVTALGFCTVEQVTAALSEQQGVPWVGQVDPEIRRDLIGLVPRAICKEFNIFPIDRQTNGLVLVGARSPIDIVVTHMLRRMLDLEVQTFIVHDELFSTRFEAYLEADQSGREEERYCRRDVGELCHQVLEVARRHRASFMKCFFYTHTLWTRVERRRAIPMDLFLRVPEEVAGPDRQRLPGGLRAAL